MPQWHVTDVGNYAVVAGLESAFIRGYHYSGISGDSEISGNSANPKVRVGKTSKVGER